jgi:putative transposase
MRVRYAKSMKAKVNTMPGPKPPEIKLTDEQRQGLEKLVRRHNTPQQIALRGRIVLATAAGQNNTQIAKKLGIDVETARLWRNRWLLLEPISLEDLSVEERLEDLPRPGAPARITADQRCQIEAMACEDPEDSGRPISHWTAREIADEIIKRGILDQISPRHAARLLKRQRSQTPSGTVLVDRGS